MIINASQNVGIGTTSPSVKLQVADTSTHCFIRVKGGTGNYAGIDFGDDDDDDISRIRHNNADNSLGFYTSNAEKMRIDAAGNVGIGTTSPAGKLDVAPDTDAFSRIGRARIGFNTHSDFASFQHIDSASGGGYALLQRTTGETYLNAASGESINFRINNADIMNMTATGLGIGTASPTSRLHVKNATDISMDAQANGQVRVEGNGYALGVALNGSGAFIYQNSSARFMAFGNNETEQVRLTTAGALHVTNDVVAFSTTPSDRRLKKNIKDIDYGLDTIMSLNPKQYDWKEDNRHDIGFIAQEVEEVIPEIVKDNEWFDEKIKTLDYEKLTAVLIKAVQEQQDQINELKGIING
tara:strand:- start:560 stop:1621 length:1062 start_codon:yes stop_codon:yes gene_type:complete